MIMLIIRLALAHVSGVSHQKTMSLMIKLCFVALMISAFALTLVVGIMNGFQKETAKKLQGIHADIIIRAPHGALDYDKITARIQKDFAKEIVACAPQAVNNLIIRSAKHDKLSPLSVCIGIDPVQEKRVTTLFSCVTQPLDDSYQYNENGIMMGVTAARGLDLGVGDPIDILYLADTPNRKNIKLNETRAVVGALFKTGIDEFDTAVVYTHLNLFKKIFKEAAISHISIKCNHGVNIQHCSSLLASRFKDLDIYTWKELYPALVSALALEKYAAFIILSLCALIAAINCMALIFMYITYKKMEIVILKTLGMSNRDISSIFLLIGFFITLGATIVGIIIACIAGWLLETYPLITLPDAYYVDHVPVLIDAPLIVTVLVTMLVLGTVASYLPARRIHTFSIAHLLKFGVE